MMAERVTRPRRRRPLLLDVARVDSDTRASADLPSRALLLRYGKVLGIEPRKGEDVAAFMKRVWKVDATRD